MGKSLAMSEQLTTIRLKAETREKLKGLGKKGETYDDILSELIEDKK